MEVNVVEQIFRAAEAKLDLLLAQAMPQLEGHSIVCADESVRSYNYKESSLSWSIRCVCSWPQDVFTCQVQVWFSCWQPVHTGDELRVKVRLRAEKFRVGQRSSIDHVSEHEYSLDQVAAQGLASMALAMFQRGASFLGVAL